MRMSAERDASREIRGPWTDLGHHDWEGTDALETTLSDALHELDGHESILYEHVDTEALRDVIDPGRERGAAEVRFRYGHHEIRLTAEGSIAAR